MGAGCGSLRPELPLGIVQSDEPIGDRLCLAIKIEQAAYREEASLRAWWWDQGSGDCSTRTSDVVSTTASITPAEADSFDVTLDLPLMGGDVRVVRLALHPTGDGMPVTAVPDEAPLEFIEVETVAPAFAPAS